MLFATTKRPATTSTTSDVDVARIAAPQRHWLWFAALATVLLLVIVSWGGSSATRFYLAEAQVRGQNTLRLAVAALRGQLARFERLPQLLADNDKIRKLVLTPDDEALVQELNLYLKQVNDLLDTSDIYVMLPDGNTVAASNFDTEVSFVGGNFSYRPYFIDALAGRLGRFFALGTTSLKRGYYFGAPIRTAQGIAGVVVIKIDVEAIEDTWQAGDYEIIVTDPEGIIFMSGNPDWLFFSILPLTEDRLARTFQTQRYANAQLRDLPVTQNGQLGEHALMTIEDDGEAREFLVVAETMPEADWAVSVLLDTASARAQALGVVILAALLLCLAALSTAIVLQRRMRLRERLEVERIAHEQLERRVLGRTAELAKVNEQLEEEIAERRATEAMLRQTQNELIQASKLAALGQMSAALSHEFNQPLTAARNYASNALVLLERGRSEDARDNVSRISSLIERLASISRHLRNFARKPKQKLGPVGLEQVIRDTLEIIDWRIRAAGAELVVDLGSTPITVTAGPIRLQQVLVNIISNAVDAVSETDDRRIELAAREAGGLVTITLRDHGPGIQPALGQRIFDPFFTTKGIGKGLGLGLSISYNIVKDFGGDLRAENHSEGGAVFVLELRAAPATTARMMEAAP